MVDEEGVVTMLDVIVELALLEVDVEVVVEEGHVNEELVLALVLLVDDEHGEKEVVGDVLVLLWTRELLVDVLEVAVELVHVEDAFRMPRFSRSVSKQFE